MSITDKRIQSWLQKGDYSSLLKKLDAIGFKDRAMIADQLGQRKDPASEDLLMALVKDEVPIVVRVACKSILQLPLSVARKEEVNKRLERTERKESRLNAANDTFFVPPGEEEERAANLRRAQEAPLRRASFESRKGERRQNYLIYVLGGSLIAAALLLRLLMKLFS